VKVAAFVGNWSEVTPIEKLFRQRRDKFSKKNEKMTCNLYAYEVSLMLCYNLLPSVHWTLASTHNPFPKICNFRKLPDITGNYRKLPEIFLTVGGAVSSKLSLGFIQTFGDLQSTAKQMQAEK
jgi:hypothetical protein